MVCAPSKERILYCVDKEIIRFLELIAAIKGKKPGALLEEIIVWWARINGLEKALATIENLFKELGREEV